MSVACALSSVVSCGGPACDPAPAASPAAAEALVLLGHHARIEGGARWVFAPTGEARLFFEGELSDAATLRLGAEVHRLPIVRTATRTGGHLAWLTPFDVADGAEGVLTVRGRAWPVRFEAAPSARLEAARGDPAKLEGIVRAPASALEELEARHALAKAAIAEQDVLRYRREQRARAARAAQLAVPSVQIAAHTADAFWALRSRAFDPAARALDAARGVELADSGWRVRIAIIQAYVDHALGRYHAVARDLEPISRLAHRHGHTRDALLVDQMRAQARSALGHHPQALEIIRALRPAFSGQGAAARMSHRADEAWIMARAADAGVRVTWQDALRALEDARAQAEALEDADTGRIIGVNLVWAEYRRGALEAAAQRLHALEGLPGFGTGYGARLAELMGARIALDRGEAAEAAERFARATEAARGESDVAEYVWRAELGWAQALDALGRSGAAGAHFEAALEALEGLSAQAGLRKDRAPFVEDRADLYAAAVRFYLRHNRPARAFEASARARAQVLSTLARTARGVLTDNREMAEGCQQVRAALSAALERTWQVAQSRRAAHEAEVAALRQRAEGCLDALSLAARADRFDPAAGRAALEADARAIVFFEDVVFVVERDGVEVWAGPLGPDLAGEAAHVYLVPGGRYDVARLAQEVVGPLLERATVSLLPALSRLASPARVRAGRGGAVVIADPRRDLVGARAEGAFVAEAMKAKLLAGDDATKAGLREALRDADYLHYAGHGVLVADDPWQAHLAMADEGRLDLEDLLLTPLGAQRVVLSGCETGARAPLSARYRLGLVDVLVMSGVRTVLAAHREVDDETTAALMKALYAAGLREDPVGAYREVARAHRARGSKAAEAFYVMGVR